MAGGNATRFLIAFAEGAHLLARQVRVGEVEKSPAATLGGGVKVDHEMLDRLRIAVYCRSALSRSWPDSFCAAIGIPRGSLLNDVGLFPGGKVAAFWKLAEIEIRRPVQLSGAG